MTEFRRRLIAAAALILSTGLADAQAPYLISTYAGGLQAPTATQATSYAFATPNGVATDLFGNTYISTSSHLVFRLDKSGNLSRVAGTGLAGFSGDGGLAVNAQLNSPQGLAVDSLGSLYIADQANQRIRQVTPAGVITTVAGTGVRSYSADDVPAIGAPLSQPFGLATDNAGNVYVADLGNNLVRKFKPGGNISRVAGNRVRSTTGDGGPATSASLNTPNSIVVDPLGAVYISDGSGQVRRVGSNGIIAHFAGTGSSGSSGDGGPAGTAQLGSQLALAMDLAGNLYIADLLFSTVRIVNPAGIIHTYAGGGGSSSDGVAAINANVPAPSSIAADSQGNLFIAERDDKVRVVSSTGVISTAAGTGSIPFSGDGGPAGLAQFANPWGIASDVAGNLYIADTGNSRVRKIAAGTGTVTTIAGNGTQTSSGNGGQALNSGVIPHIVATFGGNVYLTDTAQIRQITPGGVISMVAGTGTGGSGADNVPATGSAISSYLAGLTFDPSGNMYIADTSNNRVRKVSTGGTITTVAGTGTLGSTGDGNPGTSAQLSSPAGLAVDAAGNFLYIADSGNCRIRKLSLAPNGTISTIAGNGTCSDSGDGTAASTASISNPWGVAIDANGVIYMTTAGNTVRSISTQGVINTIAGSSAAGYSGDGGPATSSHLSFPVALMPDSLGNLYVSDFYNNAIRLLQPSGARPLLTATSVHTGTLTPGQNAQFQVTVNNASGAGPTGGTVTVVDTLPASLAPVSMGASGWICSFSSPSYTCTSSASVSGGAAYTPIDLTVSVAPNAPAQVTNQLTVSGAGDIGSSSEDPALVGSASPVLQISASHFGNFIAGGQATFFINVSNQAGAATTNSPVTVTDTLPAALSLVSLSGGSAWNCTANSCTATAALGGGAAYGPITGTVTVSSTPASVQNQATVSGGGSPNMAALDTIAIVAIPACNVTGDQFASVADVQAVINQALGLAQRANDLNTDGVVNVTDVQIVVNAALSSTCVL